MGFVLSHTGLQNKTNFLAVGFSKKCGALFKAEQTENSRLPLLVFANKGIEIGSCYLPIEIIGQSFFW